MTNQYSFPGCTNPHQDVGKYKEKRPSGVSGLGKGPLSLCRPVPSAREFLPQIPIAANISLTLNFWTYPPKLLLVVNFE